MVLNHTLNHEPLVIDRSEGQESLLVIESAAGGHCGHQGGHAGHGAHRPWNGHRGVNARARTVAIMS